MIPLVLQPEAPSVSLSLLAFFIPSHWDDLLSVKVQHPSVFVPFFYSPLGQLPVLPQVHGCLVLPAALSLSLHLSDQCPGTLHLGQSLSGPLLTACSQKRALGPGVV